MSNAEKVIEGLIEDQTGFEISVLPVSGPYPIRGTVEASKDGVVTITTDKGDTVHINITHIVSFTVKA